jgi:hypothetical protein
MILGFGNNVKGEIAADISASQTVIPVMPGTGALFASTLAVDNGLANNSLSPQVYAKVTLTDEQETIFEICHLLSVAGDSLTLIRGQEGTTPRTWYIGDHIANFSTRGSENLFVQVEDLQNGKYTASVAGGTANDLTVDVPTHFFANGTSTLNLRTPLYVIPTATNTGQATLLLTMSGQVVGTYPLTKGNNAPLKAGDMVAGLPVLVIFDATIGVFQVVNPALGLLDEAEANKYFLRIDKNLSEIAAGGIDAQGIARKNIDVVDGTLTKKGLVQLTDLSNPNDEYSVSLALTPAGLKRVADSITPLTVPVGGAMLWFSPVPPEGWLEGNGQAFDPVENPKLLEVFPSGKLPDVRSRYPKFASDPSLISTLRDGTSLEHYHLTGQFWTDYGNSGDDAFFPIRGENWGGESYGSRGVTGDTGRPIWNTTPGGTTGQTTGSSNWRNLDSSPGAPAVDPDHVFCMLIFKTDKAVSTPGEAGPTAIVITPATATIQDGGTQQFAATVLPANVAPQFPVTWSVTDPALGAIDQSGLYTSIAGASGLQTVVASVSTGLNNVATVQQFVYATSISVGAIPDTVAGTSYTAAITVSPTSANEPLIYSSSNDTVATFANGVVFGASPGTVTVTVTGQFSGVSGSTTVNILPAVVVETYLKIANNLSEIANAGPGAQTAAQANLGINAPVGQLGAVGSYAFLRYGDGVQHSAGPGYQEAGGALKYAGTIVSSGNPTPQGTWMCMGSIANTNEVSVWQRIL